MHHRNRATLLLAALSAHLRNMKLSASRYYEGRFCAEFFFLTNVAYSPGRLIEVEMMMVVVCGVVSERGRVGLVELTSTNRRGFMMTFC